MTHHLLGNASRGKLFILSAPAGTGKSTLAKMLLEEFPGVVVQSCSCTTRAARPNEVEGKDYHFLSIGEFEAKLEEGAFLESARVFGNYYGTLKQEVEAFQKAGQHVLLVIDTQGAMSIKKQGTKHVSIFVSPPSMEELKKRLFKRKTEEESSMQVRLSRAEGEMEMKTHYDYHIVNDYLSTTYQVLRSILIAEEHKNTSPKRK